MTTAKAQKFLLDRLGAGTTVLLSLHLALPEPPEWADGVDAEGRTVLLVGRHHLGEREEAQAAVRAVRMSLEAGEVPEGCHAVAAAPALSLGIADAWFGTANEILLHGPRSTGKTQGKGMIMAGLAELHCRAGFRLPLRAIWLHDSLTNASVKTARSLEDPLWSALWSIRDDRRVAALTVAGSEMVVCDFIGTQDPAAGDRSRAEAHVGLAEELIPSLDESGGIDERRYDLARSSMRLPTRRHVMVSATNPGAPDCWPYRKFIQGGGEEGCKAFAVPASDRLTPEEDAAQQRLFRSSPDLQKRLALGEWVDLKLGEAVAEGFNAAVHVSPLALEPAQTHLLAIGWDGGHSPSAVIGQLFGGQMRVYAALNDLKVGVLELIESRVIPWLTQHALWTRQGIAWSTLVHIIDSTMATPGQATITESAEKVIQDTLGGRIVHGPIKWSPRREAVLRVLAPRHEHGQMPLVINPGPETRLLVQALNGRWFYPHTPDGRVDRSGPKKPNSPYADIGDAFAYLAGWLCGGEPMDLTPHEVKVETAFSLDAYRVGMFPSL